MAKFSLRAGILGACWLSWVASGANVSCAEVGKAYNDSSVLLPQIYVADEAACQAACAGDPACKVFTYYKNKQACWKLTDQAVLLVLPNATLAAFAISGPKSCNETATKGTGDSTVVAGGDVSITDSENPSVSVNGTKTSVSRGVDLSSSASESDSKGGIPLWVWLIATAVLLIGVGGAGMYLMSEGDGKGEGKAKKKKAESNTRGVGIESPQAAPRTQAAAPAGLPAMVPVPTISQCRPVMQGAQAQQPQQQPQAQYLMQQPSHQYYQMQPQAQPQMSMQYMPVQQGYEFELTNQTRLPAGPMQQRQVQSQTGLPAQPGYMMPQGYEQV